MARWQRERREQTLVVTVFAAILFFTLGLVAWAATDRYYSANLKPAAVFDGHVYPTRDYQHELGYQLTRFYVDYGVPPGYENDSQILTQKATYDTVALENLVQQAIFDDNAHTDGIVVTQQQIDDRYLVDFGEYHARHILITPKPDASATDAAAAAAVADATALAKARAVADQLKQSPNDQTLWNALATQYSDDTSSAPSGGDLGFVGKGQFVKEFEDTVKTMQIGQVSDPVKSQFGYHIIQLLEKRPPSESAFVKRAISYGYSVADVKHHVRYAILNDEYTTRAKALSVTSPTPQVHLAWIAVASPKVNNGDFQAFTDQLTKVAAIQKALDAGTDFAATVKKYSEDATTTDTGGDLGWFAKGMITKLDIEQDVFSLDVGKVSSQKSDSSQTVWYKVLEKDPSRALEDAQKTKVSDNAFSYWYQQQKKAHVIQKLVPGHELDS